MGFLEPLQKPTFVDRRTRLWTGTSESLRIGEADAAHQREALLPLVELVSGEASVFCGPWTAGTPGTTGFMRVSSWVSRNVFVGKFLCLNFVFHRTQVVKDRKNFQRLNYQQDAQKTWSDKRSMMLKGWKPNFLRPEMLCLSTAQLTSNGWRDPKWHSLESLRNFFLAVAPWTFVSKFFPKIGWLVTSPCFLFSMKVLPGLAMC